MAWAEIVVTVAGAVVLLYVTVSVALLCVRQWRRDA